MNISIAQMRSILKEQYGRSRKWSAKVDSMSDNQVMAIYYRMLRSGQLDSDEQD